MLKTDKYTRIQIGTRRTDGYARPIYGCSCQKFICDIKTTVYLTVLDKSRIWYTQKSGPNGEYERTLPYIVDIYEGVPYTIIYVPTYSVVMHSKCQHGVMTSTYDFFGLRVVSAPVVVPRNTDFISVSSKSDAELKVRLLKCIKHQKVNAAVSLAEWKQTTRMLLNTAKTIARGIHSLRTGRFRQAFSAYRSGGSLAVARRVSRDFANRWLENAYGWQPLLFDCKGAAEAIGERMMKPITVKCKKSHSVEDTKSAPDYGASLGFTDINHPCSSTVRIKFMGSVRRQTVLKYWYRGEYVSNAYRDLEAFGLTNPLEIAWELIPFSFVIDWFIPIGNYLSSLLVFPNLRFIDAGTSRLSKNVCTGQWSTAFTTGPNFKLGPGMSETISYRRDPVLQQDLYVQPAALLLPDYRLNLDQFISGVSLLRVRLFHS